MPVYRPPAALYTILENIQFPHTHHHFVGQQNSSNVHAPHQQQGQRGGSDVVTCIYANIGIFSPQNTINIIR